MTGHVATVAPHLDVLKTVAALVALIIVFGIFRLVKRLIKAITIEVIVVLIVRHFTGQHYHGRRVTDATWWSHGSTTTRKYGTESWLSRWEHKPQGHRALWRLGCTLGFFGLIYGVVSDWTVTMNALKSFGVYLVVVIGFLIENKVRLRLHSRAINRPIAKGIAQILRISPHAAMRLLHISPENIKDEGEIGYFELPEGHTPSPEQWAAMERIIDIHLPVDIEFEAMLQQTPRIGVIRAGLEPPPYVGLEEILPAMEEAAYGEVVFGKDRRKENFSANFVEEEDPHWAFCMQSKRGKSNLLGLIAITVLHQDPQARVIAVDPKRSSLTEFLGSPSYTPGSNLKPLLKGVTMANDPRNPDAMINAIGLALKIYDQRSEEYSQNPRQFPICLVLVDELNFLHQIIKDRWNQVLADNARLPKDLREDLPAECPIWRDIRSLLQAGRFVGIHVIAVAQDFTAEIVGGKGARNLFGLRAMAGYKDNQWGYFMGAGTPPKPQRGKGRVIFRQDEDDTWVQIAHLNDAQKAYDWANDGREAFTDELMPAAETVPAIESVHNVDHVVSSGDLLEQPADTQTPGPAAERRIIITMEAAAEYLGISFYAFEQARRRYLRKHKTDRLPNEFRDSNKLCWYAKDLDAWWDSLPGQQRKEITDG